jgi:hypothetical protein
MQRQSEQLQKLEAEYSTYHPIRVKVCSWNLGGREPPVNVDLAQWVLGSPPHRETPDVLVVGLQEMVKLNAKNVLSGASHEVVKMWHGVISTTLTNAG